MDYHGRIMNIECLPPARMNQHPVDPECGAYRIGHRDARHAAAEIACEADKALREKDAEIARLREALESASSFAVGRDIRVDKCWQRDGSFLWAVRKFGNVLANDGAGWNYETIPSERDEAFMARYRFTTMELAMTAARAALAQVAEVSNG